MPKRREWKQAQSVGHANTRLIFITADLVRELIPDSDAKTTIGGKWELSELSDKNPPEKVLTLRLKKFEKWPPNE
jgi:hypothetical protein